jgi:hypothetical protein
MARAKKTQIATMSDFENKFEKLAQEQYDREPGGSSNWIGLKNSEFSFQGETTDVLNVIILADVYEHAFYDSPWNPDDPMPPACFSLAEEEENLEPNGDGPDIQHEGLCSDCWANEWGSSDNGRGKQCKNSRRIAVLGVLTDDDGNIESIATDEVAFIRVAPTSLKNYSGYIKRSNKVTRRPSYAYVTELSFDLDAEYETLVFNLVGKVNDPQQLAEIEELIEGATEQLLEPFDVSKYKTPEEVKKSRRSAAPKARTTKKKVAKKKVAKKKVAAKRGRSKMS